MIKHLNRISTLILSLAILGTVFPASASEKKSDDNKNIAVHDEIETKVDEEGNVVLELTLDNNCGFEDNNGNVQFYNVAGEQVKSSWVNSNGKWYYFDELGMMVKGWKNISGKWYYFLDDGSKTTEWLEKNNKWYYLGQDGAMKESQWIKIGGKWYYFDENGVMDSNAVKDN